MHPVRRRLVSIVSPWRAVAELDGLSDEEGRALVDTIVAWRRPRRTRTLSAPLLSALAGYLGAITAFGGVTPEVGFGALVLVCLIGYVLARRRGAPRPGMMIALIVVLVATVAATVMRVAMSVAYVPAPVLQLGIVFIVLLSGALLGGALVRRICEAVLIRRRVLSRLRGDWCQGCAYPMYELPASDGPVACPRCGRPCIAREAIRCAADVLACDVEAHAERVRRERGVVAACGCGYPLGGLPVEDGCVRCPECGEGYGAREGGFVRMGVEGARVGG